MLNFIYKLLNFFDFFPFYILKKNSRYRNISRDSGFPKYTMILNLDVHIYASLSQLYNVEDGATIKNGPSIFF